MKNRFLLMPAVFSLVLTGAAVAQDARPTATPAAAVPVPAASPKPETIPTPTDIAPEAAVTPASADEAALPATSPKPAAPTPVEAAPEASPTASEPPTSTSEATVPATPPKSEAPAASSETAADADLLEPTDVNLGAPPPEPSPGDELPSGETSASEVPNPDDTLIPPESEPSDIAPPPAPVLTENKYDQERKLKVRYQEVKLQALKDAAVRSLHEQAESSKTDEGKRQALREYYRLLFARMVAIDGKLKDKCDTMQQAYLRRLGQYRVEPTIPLAPPPTPEPLESAEATPPSKTKAKRGG